MRANPQLWTYELSDQDIAELDAAVLGVEARADFVSEVGDLSCQPHAPLAAWLA